MNFFIWAWNLRLHEKKVQVDSWSVVMKCTWAHREPIKLKINQYYPLKSFSIKDAFFSKPLKSIYAMLSYIHWNKYSSYLGTMLVYVLSVIALSFSTTLGSLGLLFPVVICTVFRSLSIVFCSIPFSFVLRFLWFRQLFACFQVALFLSLCSVFSIHSYIFPRNS